jgi:4-hydroxy 2-oxovalerate aldolase
MAKKQHPQFEILDCTIRDGGYLNNWNFDRKFVRELYRNLSRTGVDTVEIGFRHFQKKDYGIWYSTPEELLHELFGDIRGASIALLVDQGEADLARIPKAKNSLVDLYRVTSNKYSIPGALKMCDEIKAKGYKVSLQLMGIVGYSDKDMASVIKPLTKSSVDYIYFADSYGSLFPQNIKKFIDWLKPTKKKIGFHPHNNLQLAFANTLEAIHCGIDIVDGTVYGMGRGAGNLPLEVLISYLEKTLNHEKYNALPILDLIDRYFIKLNDEIKWGYNLPYMLSGLLEVHPNYAKALTDRREHAADDMVKILETVKGLNPVGFDKETLDKVVESGFTKPVEGKQAEENTARKIAQLRKKEKVTYKDRHAGKDFLILANGATLKEYKAEIDEFIKKNNPVVMGGNYLGGLFKPEYHGFSNRKRFMAYIEEVAPESKLLVSSTFAEKFVRDYTDRNFESIVHLDRISSSFDIQDSIITSNCRSIALLLVATAIVMGAKRIFIAGMDGYKSKENFRSNKLHFYDEAVETKNFRMLLELHNWNEKLLGSINDYLTNRGKDGLYIITPTSHKQFYKSIYNWKVDVVREPLAVDRPRRTAHHVKS